RGVAAAERQRPLVEVVDTHRRQRRHLAVLEADGTREPRLLDRAEPGLHGEVEGCRRGRAIGCSATLAELHIAAEDRARQAEPGFPFPVERGGANRPAWRAALRRQ